MAYPTTGSEDARLTLQTNVSARNIAHASTSTAATPPPPKSSGESEQAQIFSRSKDIPSAEATEDRRHNLFKRVRNHEEYAENRAALLLGKWVDGDGYSGIAGLKTGVNAEPTGSVVLSQFNKRKWLPLAQKAPFLIGEQCCRIIKESPLDKYQRQNKVAYYIGTMAAESRVRRQAWLRNGCNAFDGKKRKSTPLAFWTEQDVLNYIRLNDIKICDLYGEVILTDKKGQVVTVDKDDPLEPMPKGCKLCTTGLQRTGCVACGYGVHREKANEEPRFAKLKRINPRQYEYVLGGGQWIDNPDYDPDYDGTPDEIGWIKWNPPKLWIPSKEGLGMKFVFDYCNDLYGKKLWRYE